MINIYSLSKPSPTPTLVKEPEEHTVFFLCTQLGLIRLISLLDLRPQKSSYIISELLCPVRIITALLT